MAVISGVLKGPMGDLRVGVVIELRAVRTSATVVIQARSQSVTDATGRYTLNVEVGQYDVMVTSAGRQPERVGSIQVMVNSATGTLNDFLTIPGETDLNPAIVETVDRMRAEAAASAAAAAVSAASAAASATDTVKKSVTINQTIDGPLTLNGDQNLQVKAVGATATLRFRDSTGLEKGAIYNATTAGAMGIRWAGNAYTVVLKDDGTVTFPSIVYVGAKALIQAGEFGIGGTALHQADALQSVSKIYRVTNASANKPPQEGQYSVISMPMDGTGSVAYLFVSITGKVRVGASTAASAGVVTSHGLWGDANTTVDANGFIKAASPIVKLFADGTSELNEESQGVTTERVEVGVYRVSGTLGFNSDAGWGGVDGGIEIPIDRNKLPLVWVDYEVDESGDLLIKTFHRVNSTAPKFAQNVKVGYKEGAPIDIPTGRWIDLRVEMPAGDEPEPQYEPELIPAEEPTPGETPAPTEEPKE